jgi:uncharacterized membrane protein YcaP (DUF421 family)
MDVFRVAIRCLATCLFLLVMLRMSGKRLISQSTAFDFVLSLIVGDLVDDLLFLEVPASQFIIAIAALVLADLTVRLIGYRNAAFEFLVNGRPTVLVQQGEQLQVGLDIELMHPADLRALLRIKGFDEQTQNEVKIAVMEDSGELSVLRKDAANALQKKEKEVLQKPSE